MLSSKRFLYRGPYNNSARSVGGQPTGMVSVTRSNFTELSKLSDHERRKVRPRAGLMRDTRWWSTADSENLKTINPRLNASSSDQPSGHRRRSSPELNHANPPSCHTDQASESKRLLPQRKSRTQGRACIRSCGRTAPQFLCPASSEIGDGVAPAGRPLCPRAGDHVWPEAPVDVACLLHVALKIGQHHLTQIAIQPREDEALAVALAFHSIRSHAGHVV